MGIVPKHYYCSKITLKSQNQPSGSLLHLFPETFKQTQSSFSDWMCHRYYYKREKEEMEQYSSKSEPPKSLMENLLGLLRVRVKRGVNLAVRDVRSSDPYVLLKMGKQKLKTRVIKKDVNPEWNEDITFSVLDPNLPILLIVYDHDTFSKDDKMGDAEIEISPFIEALRSNVTGLPSGTVISRIQPSKQNCLADESCITYTSGKVIQDMILRLQNVECGEVEIQLHWIHLPGCKGL
ncbi:PREDICTED: protein C2-DOMAIN ABA-RELATED 4-like isoform X1 [Lupinus angustifolius]|nr:PREDICTED: protein C2-DOMAIN ABA-RELATED 4-like isoform X1 [Lupinus angustifolius]XP_019433180.1 PREDICTED: protein C2-DOMAIN ABA-RELATED 4-like isoform X1 [Lupinus angustifolius]